jgi:hypothetical protein
MQIQNGTINTIVQGDCSHAIFPPAYQPTIQTINPLNGITTTYTGFITQHSGCQLRCIFDPTQSYFITDISDIKQPMGLTAYPIPFNEFIKLNHNSNIEEVLIYDAQGKMLNNFMMHENTINTKSLKKGVYFIQVKFSDKKVKSIKVVK